LDRERKAYAETQEETFMPPSDSTPPDEMAAQDSPPQEDAAVTPPESKKDASEKLWQQQARAYVVPYLPPPVVKGIASIDAQLEATVGPEATMTIASTILASWLVLVLIRFFSKRLTGGGKAIADDDEDNVLSKSAMKNKVEYDATVLFCGPMGGGKTRLFYQICTEEKVAKTVTSIKANVGIAPMKRERGDTATIRYIDWPGHAPLADSGLEPLWKAPTDKVRVVLVLDATQPVAAAASVLYHLWEGAATAKRRRTILVACHKKDFPKAKNWKRVKIQLRTELERLVMTKKPEWWPASKEVELDDLPQCDLYFCSTTCESNGLVPIEDYCRKGKLPEQSD
jgi:signal recognition particle receptor subunit beta